MDLSACSRFRVCAHASNSMRAGRACRHGADLAEPAARDAHLIGKTEGAIREYAVLTRDFSGADGRSQKLQCVKVDDKFKPLAGTEFDIDAELVLLAMGFVHPVHERLLKTIGVELDQRGNVKANLSDYQTSLPKVFSAGDMRRGQSLVVGHPRGPPLRAIDRPVPDGLDGFAAVGPIRKNRRSILMITTKTVVIGTGTPPANPFIFLNKIGRNKIKRVVPVVGRRAL
jgi:hypothetical protein